MHAGGALQIERLIVFVQPDSSLLYETWGAAPGFAWLSDNQSVTFISILMSQHTSVNLIQFTTVMFAQIFDAFLMLVQTLLVSCSHGCTDFEPDWRSITKVLLREPIRSHMSRCVRHEEAVYTRDSVLM